MELKIEQETIQTEDTQTNTLVQQSNIQPDDNWLIQDDSPYVSAKPAMSKEAFYKSGAMQDDRKQITTSAVTIYILCIMNIVLNLFLYNNIFGLVDVILLFGLALGIHIGKSRACAGVLLGYSIINAIGLLITTGRLGGYLVIFAGVYALMGTIHFHKAWEQYLTTGSYTEV